MGPLSEEEKAGLIIDYAIDREGVYGLEQLNIEKAVLWTFGKRIDQTQLFSESFVNRLHHRMYGQIWKWGGTYRTSERNIGIEFYRIPQQLKVLLDDALYWYEHQTYNPVELAIRFKHRLVSIHCYPNGNGRHSRLMADLIVEKLYSKKVFSWGGSSLVRDDEKRRLYIDALRKADNGDFNDLTAFALS